MRLPQHSQTTFTPSLDSAADTFTKKVSVLLKEALGEKFLDYQRASYQEQYFLLCQAIGHGCGMVSLSLLYQVKPFLTPSFIAIQGKMEEIFNEYKPNMVGVEDLNRELARVSKKTSPKEGGPLFYILGPRIDAYESAGFPALRGAILQAASQFNNLEFSKPEKDDPIMLSYDWTQGPAVQKGCPALALARYRYWNMNKQEDSFLRHWLYETIHFDGRDLTFNEIFKLQFGYLRPKIDMEEAALQFIREHKNSLLLNIEFTEFTQAQHAITQVLSAAMALGNYDTDAPHRKPENKIHLVDACRELLKVQYEIIAKLAVLEAKKSPERRIPLVLTAVGGGVFGNNRVAINDAISVAIQVVKEADVRNIDFAISVYAESDLSNYRDLFKQHCVAFQEVTYDKLKIYKNLREAQPPVAAAPMHHDLTEYCFTEMEAHKGYIVFIATNPSLRIKIPMHRPVHALLLQINENPENEYWLFQGDPQYEILNHLVSTFSGSMNWHAPIKTPFNLRLPGIQVKEARPPVASAPIQSVLTEYHFTQMEVNDRHFKLIAHPSLYVTMPKAAAQEALPLRINGNSGDEYWFLKGDPGYPILRKIVDLYNRSPNFTMPLVEPITLQLPVKITQTPAVSKQSDAMSAAATVEAAPSEATAASAPASMPSTTDSSLAVPAETPAKPFFAPPNPRYIQIDAETNTVHVMMPLSGAAYLPPGDATTDGKTKDILAIATDINCRAGIALKQFFGKEHVPNYKDAVHELEKYRNSLYEEIDYLRKINDEEAMIACQDRAAQVSDYIRVLMPIYNHPYFNTLSKEAPLFPDLIKMFLERKSNLSVMHLRPKEPDDLRFSNPIFSVNRNDLGKNALSLSLRFCKFEFSKKAEVEIFKNMVSEHILKEPCISDIKKFPNFSAVVEALLPFLSTKFKEYCGVCVDFGNKESVISDLISIHQFDVENNPVLNSDGSVNADTLKSLVAAMIDQRNNKTSEPLPFTTISYFYEIGSHAADTNETISVMTQFLLGIINIFAYQNGLTKENFGGVFDASITLSKALVTLVSRTLADGKVVEHAVCDFINDRTTDFGMERKLTSEEVKKITTQFGMLFNIVKDGDNFDEFAVVVDADENGNFFYHQYAICVRLYEFIRFLISDEGAREKLSSDFSVALEGFISTDTYTRASEIKLPTLLLPAHDEPSAIASETPAAEDKLPSEKTPDHPSCSPKDPYYTTCHFSNVANYTGNVTLYTENKQFRVIVVRSPYEAGQELTLFVIANDERRKYALTQDEPGYDQICGILNKYKIDDVTLGAPTPERISIPIPSKLLETPTVANGYTFFGAPAPSLLSSSYSQCQLRR